MRPIHRFALVASCGLALLSTWPCGAALAQAKSPAASAKTNKSAGKSPRAVGAADAKTTAAIAKARQLMASGKREDVEAGIQSLGLLGGAAAVAPLQERIRQGLPPDLLETAIVTLMALSQPEAGPVLFELTTHRRPETRLRAIEALSATQPAGAETALTAALSDSDPSVRSAAATGLGELKAASTLERLFLALDRGNMEASGAIGKVVPASEIRRLADYLGRLPFRSMGPALAEVLQRPDVSDAAKLELIARLEEVGTKEVKGFFTDLVAAASGNLPQPISRAMLRAVQEIAE